MRSGHWKFLWRAQFLKLRHCVAHTQRSDRKLHDLSSTILIADRHPTICFARYRISRWYALQEANAQTYNILYIRDDVYIDIFRSDSGLVSSIRPPVRFRKLNSLTRFYVWRIIRRLIVSVYCSRYLYTLYSMANLQSFVVDLSNPPRIWFDYLLCVCAFVLSTTSSVIFFWEVNTVNRTQPNQYPRHMVCVCV